jgi:lysine 6-dehydrogenase
MMKTVTIVGAGMQSRAILYDLLKRSTINNIKKIYLVDRSDSQLRSLKTYVSDKNLSGKIPIESKNFDLDDIISSGFSHTESRMEKEFAVLIASSDILIGASTYKHNAFMSQICIENKCNFVDLGGNNSVVSLQNKMSPLAEKKGVTIIPDCGLAPGMVNVVAAHYAKNSPKSLNIYVGGIPQKPKNIMKYELVFSPTGLVNEYVEDCHIKKEGEVMVVPPLTGLVSLPPLGKYKDLEAFRTSGGISGMAQNIKHVQNLEYKTIRYAGHRGQISLMNELGLFEPARRTETEKKMSELLKPEGDDVVLVRIEEIDEKNETIYHDLIVNPQDGLTAMQVATGFSVASVVEMLCRGIIRDHGTLSQENGIPQKPFMDMLEQRGIIFT